MNVAQCGIMSPTKPIMPEFATQKASKIEQSKNMILVMCAALIPRVVAVSSPSLSTSILEENSTIGGTRIADAIKRMMLFEGVGKE